MKRSKLSDTPVNKFCSYTVIRDVEMVPKTRIHFNSCDAVTMICTRMTLKIKLDLDIQTVHLIINKRPK